MRTKARCGNTGMTAQHHICKNCQYWKVAVFGWVDKDFEPQSCESGNCLCPKFLHAPKHALESDTLVFCDAEEYHVDVWVGSNFGCVHWEARL